MTWFCCLHLIYLIKKTLFPSVNIEPVVIQSWVFKQIIPEMSQARSPAQWCGPGSWGSQKPRQSSPLGTRHPTCRAGCRQQDWTAEISSSARRRSSSSCCRPNRDSGQCESRVLCWSDQLVSCCNRVPRIWPASRTTWWRRLTRGWGSTASRIQTKSRPAIEPYT